MQTMEGDAAQDKKCAPDAGGPGQTLPRASAASGYAALSDSYVAPPTGAKRAAPADGSAFAGGSGAAAAANGAANGAPGRLAPPALPAGLSASAAATRPGEAAAAARQPGAARGASLGAAAPAPAPRSAASSYTSLADAYQGVQPPQTHPAGSVAGSHRRSPASPLRRAAAAARGGAAPARSEGPASWAAAGGASAAVSSRSLASQWRDSLAAFADGAGAGAAGWGAAPGRAVSGASDAGTASEPGGGGWAGGARAGERIDAADGNGGAARPSPWSSSELPAWARPQADRAEEPWPPAGARLAELQLDAHAAAAAGAPGGGASAARPPGEANGSAGHAGHQRADAEAVGEPPGGGWLGAWRAPPDTSGPGAACAMLCYLKLPEHCCLTH